MPHTTSESYVILFDGFPETSFPICSCVWKLDSHVEGLWNLSETKPCWGSSVTSGDFWGFIISTHFLLSASLCRWNVISKFTGSVTMPTEKEAGPIWSFLCGSPTLSSRQSCHRLPTVLLSGSFPQLCLVLALFIYKAVLVWCSSPVPHCLLQLINLLRGSMCWVVNFICLKRIFLGLLLLHSELISLHK